MFNLRIFNRTLLPACLAALAQTAVAQSCLEDITISKVGELTLTIDGADQTREFLAITIEDFVFGDIEAFTSAAYLRDPDGINPDFHMWSLTAYPVGYADTLASALCGEDVLAAFDNYQKLADLGGLLSGALASISPTQASAIPLLDAQLRRDVDEAAMAEIVALRADIAAFDMQLPDRAGAVHVSLRNANMSPNAVMMDMTLSPDEKFEILERLQGPALAQMLDNPETLTCPCEMDVVETHIYGADGPPYRAPSRSWGLIDTRNALFTATLTEIAKADDGTYSVAGTFDGAVVDVVPDLSSAGALGTVALTKGDTFTPVSGSFTITGVMAGTLARLPKVF